MSSFIGKYIARRFFQESVNNAFGTEDPYFEEVPMEDMAANKNRKQKKRRRPPPAGISDNDAKVLTRVKRRSYYLDMSLGMCCCGLGIGWSAVIGFIPGIGDIIACYLSYQVVRLANQIDGGLPTALYSQMIGNVMLDFAFGLVPIVGDVVNVLYKANSRNSLLLEKHLRKVGQHNLKHGNAPTPAPNQARPPANPNSFQRPNTTAPVGSSTNPESTNTAQPQSSSWFGWGSGDRDNGGGSSGTNAQQSGMRNVEGGDYDVETGVRR
ncbi:hypothetical protein BZA70DRAFT_286963 [Myxozyma melibiosi]|uniref:PH domain-containing protein n=1 Tax=Myxozyma melibiosi TaxID=54550 RepID=A0ABR1FCN2_9ASCO